MTPGVTRTVETKPVPANTIPDGNYKARWTGYSLSVKVGESVITQSTNFGAPRTLTGEVDVVYTNGVPNVDLGT
jgi:hypothetical protein